MPSYYRKYKTILLHDGNKVIIYRGRPGVTENYFCFSLISVKNISDERVADINKKGKLYCEHESAQAWAKQNKMGPVILFKKETTYVGRNGSGRMIGVEILESLTEQTVSLTPMNTKGLARCRLQIPNDALDGFIYALQLIKNKMDANV
ncbi:MAG TPA: hypothetical protein VGM30_10300 [Puia sp.]|jgi:hypothetical protein